MSDLKYSVIKDIEQYYTYCKTLETLLVQEGESVHNQDEIELLTLLIKTWDKQDSSEATIDPVTFLKQLMETNGLSQNQLAEIAGVGKSYMSEILNYKKYMSRDIIRILARHFSVQQEALNKTYELTGRSKTLRDKKRHQTA